MKCAQHARFGPMIPLVSRKRRGWLDLDLFFIDCHSSDLIPAGSCSATVLRIKIGVLLNEWSYLRSQNKAVRDTKTLCPICVALAVVGGEY